MLVLPTEEPMYLLSDAQSTFRRKRFYPQTKVNEATFLLRDASQPVILTGAGISAGSGVPTFRDGVSSLWGNEELMQLAEHETFLRDPASVWRAHETMRAIVEQCVPNAAHLAIARLCQQKPATKVFTQNVDGLHEESGIAAHELHGSLRRFVCINCGLARRASCSAPAEYGAIVCGACGGRLRHDTVLFGEPVRCQDEALACLQQTDLVIFVGTSGMVTPTREIAWAMRRRRVRVIEINPMAITSSSLVVYLHIRAKAEHVLPEMID